MLRDGPDEWFSFAEAYWSCADARVNELSRTDGGTNAAAPVLFLLRQYVELSLKGLFAIGAELQQMLYAPPPYHTLGPLWEQVRALILEFSPDSAGVWLDRSREIISQFDAVDARSFTFRYPVTTRGDPSGVPTTVSLESVRDVMLELRIVLDGAGALLGELRDLARELGEM
ncbi:MAG TPA: hypothetical protein VNV25_02275 [Gemmatimonadaceae bacterium]|nr:hypothetical protein [Gemmatimonadaceae bacterium]